MVLIGWLRRVKARVFYGWVIVAISLVTMTISYSAYMSWPVFYVAILDEFGWSRAETAIIFSVAAAVYGFSSPVSGILFDKFGPRKLFTAAAILLVAGVAGCSRAYEIWQFCIFFGFMVGIGLASAGYIPNTALVSAWFKKKRAAALGISQLGTRDTFILVPLIQLAILALGWRNSYLIIAAFMFIIIIPIAQFLRSRPQDMGLLPDGEAHAEEKRIMQQRGNDEDIVSTAGASPEWPLRRVIRARQFWAILSMQISIGLPFSALINHFVAFITDIGFTALFAANLLLIYAVAIIVARVFSFVSDKIGRENSMTIALTMVLSALAILLFARDTSTTMMLYVAAACYGIGNGFYGPVYGASAADLFQGKTFGLIIGLANVGFGLSSSIGTWLFGYIFDVTGAYTLAIVITMFAVCIIYIAVWVAAPRKVRRVYRE